MSSFTENLGNFLTECRNSAIAELSDNQKYTDWKNKQISLNFKIETELGAEFLDEYMDALIAVHSMEMNTALIFGATCYTEIGRRFDASLPESEELVKNMIG